MKKLLSVFLLILMICLALPVSVKAWDSNNCPWKDYNNYLFYNNTNQEKKSGFVTECILIKFDPDYVSSTTITVSDFFELAPLIDYFVYNKDSGYFYVYLKEPDFGLDENGYPIYTKEWIDQVISGMQSVANLTYSLDYMPVTAELLEELKLDRTLYFGCKGNDVKEAQKYLRAYGYLTATPDGSFGAMSESKLKSFEKIFSSAQDLPKDKQKQLMQIVAEFLRSGGQNVKSWYNRMRAEYETDGENELQ